VGGKLKDGHVPIRINPNDSKIRDWGVIDELFAVFCEIEEVLPVINMSPDEFRKAVADRLNIDLDVYQKMLQSEGRAALKRRLWQTAMIDNNAMMQKFLAINYLGMSDKVSIDGNVKHSGTWTEFVLNAQKSNDED
jgi:hypothetical protein